MKPSVQFVAFAAFALVAAFTAFGQSSAGSSELLSSRQLNSLVAAARTAEDHEQLARFYEAKADWYRAQAQKHAVMLAYMMANNATNNEKTRFGTVNHCEYLFRSLNQRARAAHKLAIEQEQMAQATPAE